LLHKIADLEIWFAVYNGSLVPRPNARAREGSGYTSPNPWARFRMLKRPMGSQNGVY